MKSSSLGGAARQRSMGGPGPRPIEVNKAITDLKSNIYADNDFPS